MTCDTANFLSLFDRPGDLAPEDVAALATHISACPHCTARPADTADAAIAAAMKAVPMPTGLSDALRVSAFRTQSALARQAWLRKFARVAVVVVAGLLCVAGLQRLLTPTVDAESLLQDYDPATRSADYDTWRLSHDLPPLPEDFDLSLISFTGELALEGRRVPALRFRAGYQQEATVYFVRESRLHLVNASDAVGSAGTLRVHHDGRWTILVLHTGTSLAPFLNKLGAN
jgi:hypothetical protein